MSNIEAENMEKKQQVNPNFCRIYSFKSKIPVMKQQIPKQMPYGNVSEQTLFPSQLSELDESNDRELNEIKSKLERSKRISKAWEKRAGIFEEECKNLRQLLQISQDNKDSIKRLKIALSEKELALLETEKDNQRLREEIQKLSTICSGPNRNLNGSITAMTTFSKSENSIRDDACCQDAAKEIEIQNIPNSKVLNNETNQLSTNNSNLVQENLLYQKIIDAMQLMVEEIHHEQTKALENKTIEIEQLNDTVVALNNLNQELYTEFEKEHNAHNKQILDLNEYIAKLIKNHDTQEEELLTQKHENGELENRYKKLEIKHEQLCNGWQIKINQTEATLEYMKNECDTKCQELEALRNSFWEQVKAQKISKEMHSSQVQELEANFETLKTEFNKKQEKLVETIKQVERLEQIIADQDALFCKLKSEYENETFELKSRIEHVKLESQMRISELEERLESAEKRILENTCEKGMEILALESHLNKLEAENEKLQQSIILPQIWKTKEAILEKQVDSLRMSYQKSLRNASKLLSNQLDAKDLTLRANLLSQIKKQRLKIASLEYKQLVDCEIQTCLHLKILSSLKEKRSVAK